MVSLLALLAADRRDQTGLMYVNETATVTQRVKTGSAVTRGTARNPAPGDDGQDAASSGIPIQQDCR
ncbi:hypothetical protein [Solimonas aquatica]|uniref:hypothetical protein n=1 Tax=Solimonas aquatica TaxID=489703 RepID=UPI000B8436FE|nr:hypothetical protein [Solimonas aquatica]